MVPGAYVRAYHLGMAKKPDSPMKLARKARGFTQAEVAELLQTNQPTYQRWETGENDPGVRNLVRVADLLEVSTDYLLGRSEAVSIEDGVADRIHAARVTAMDDALLAFRALLSVAQVDPTTAGAVLRAVPPIAQEAQSAREAGDDVLSAVSALARHMLRQSPVEALPQ